MSPPALGRQETQLDQGLTQATLEPPKCLKAAQGLEIDALTQILARRLAPPPTASSTIGLGACCIEEGFRIITALELTGRLQLQIVILQSSAERGP